MLLRYGSEVCACARGADCHSSYCGPHGALQACCVPCFFPSKVLCGAVGASRCLATVTAASPCTFPSAQRIPGASLCHQRLKLLRACAVRHNAATQHLQKLLHHTLELLHWMDRRVGSAAEATNALVFARVVLKHLTESLTGPQLAEFVNTPLARGAGQAAPKGASAAFCLCMPGLRATLTHQSAYSLQIGT